MTQYTPGAFPRPLLFAFYMVALAFVLPSLMEFALVTFPYRGSEASWRFGAAGLFYNSVAVSPIFGLAMAAVAAYLLDQRTMLRVLSVIAFVLGVLLIISFPFFILDFLQLRKQVNPAGKDGYDYVSLKAVLTGSIMALAALVVAVGAWRSTTATRPVVKARKAPPANSNLVVGSTPSA